MTTKALKPHPPGPRRFLCERCGGSGIQPAGCWTGKAYDSQEGKCDLCDGVGYLGIIPSILEEYPGAFDQIPG